MAPTLDRAFFRALDTMLLVDQGVTPSGGEDCFVQALGKNSALLGVFDGCGGLGSRTYSGLGGHTGAYLAARAAAGAAYDWYRALAEDALSDPDAAVTELRRRLDAALAVVRSQGRSTLRVRGTMVRDFPTTAAIALMHGAQDGMTLDLIWAGDSRVYLLDAGGLAQLTEDDLDGEDALSNLTHDGALTNVIAADGRYTLHHRRMTISRPAVIFAATDGVFGYIRTPMEFEWLLLRVLCDADTPAAFSARLKEILSEVAGDDFTLALTSFFFGDFAALRGAFSARVQALERDYVRPLHAQRTDALQQTLWARYRVGYERYLSALRGGTPLG